MKFDIFKILPMLLGLSVIVNCRSISDLLSPGNIELALKSETANEKVLFGYFENRGKENNANQIKNLEDLLKFHFLKKGFAILEIENKRHINKTPTQSESASKEKNFLSIIENENSNEITREKFLSKNDIHELSKKYAFDYFVEGSIGIFNANNILDEKKTALTILKIHDQKGDLIGITSFSIQKESESDTFLVNVTSSKIAAIFLEKISGREKIK